MCLCAWMYVHAHACVYTVCGLGTHAVTLCHSEVFKDGKRPNKKVDTRISLQKLLKHQGWAINVQNSVFKK